MVPDTGSSNLWVYAHKCWSVPCWTHKTFDNSKSSTYKADGAVFDITYGSGGVKGTVGHDVAQLAGITATMGFGEITSASGVSFLASKMSGIIGLAYDTISVNKLPTWMDLNTLSDKSFTFFLHSNPTKSYLAFPGQAVEGYGAAQVHKVVDERYWALNLTAVTDCLQQDIPITGYKAVIDSGTSLIVGPKLIIDELIKDLTINSDCSNMSELKDISFAIDGQEYPLAAVDYVLNIQGECMLGIAAMDLPKGFNFIILGDVFMRKYPSTFNLNDNTVTFQA